MDASIFPSQPNGHTQTRSDLEVDVVAICRTISHHEQAIMTLDDQINAMMKTVRQMEYNKLQHGAEIRRCKSITTLAIRLPPEILASIFEESIRDGWTRTPLTVSHVCSSWRRATSIPSVWSHVYVNLDARDPYQRSRLWLDKSQDAPLTIDIEIGNDITHLPKTMIILSKEMKRWKALSLKSVHSDPVNQFLRFCGRSAPQLQAVYIHIQEPLDNNPSPLIPLSNSFINASQFCTLHIERRFVSQPGFIPASVSVLSLRLLSSATQSIASALRLLDSLPLLSSFSLEVPLGQQQTFAMDANPGQIVALGQLESLTLMGSNSIFGILSHLKLPGLTHLYLRSSLEYTLAEETGDWIAVFLERSSPPMILLEIRDLLIDSACLARYFQLLPSLQELRLHDVDINDAALRLLHAPRRLCPHLTRLDFRWCGRMSGRALVALVQSRMSGEPYPTITSIEVITVINCSFVKEEDIIDLGEMTLCCLILREQEDYCNGPGCCENKRYRKRLKHRNLLRPSFTNIRADRGVVL
ncbi:hypothetical protein BYT27DRAFT_7182789 [Phlegmacium glaucopus]|nr:hypothetical protein BYT27DRAFT_7182789 [Phlegmacium glaucopus]